MRHRWAACLLAAAFTSAAAPPPPLIGTGQPTTPVQETANFQTVSSFHLILSSGASARAAAARILANDFHSHDLEQPSGAQAFAAHGAQRDGTSPGDPATCLFAITDGGLTLLAYPAAGPDPGARFRSQLFEVTRGRITQIWASGPTDAVAAPSPQSPEALPAPAIRDGLRVLIPAGNAPADLRNANKRLVEQFIRAFFVLGDVKARADLSTDLRSHVAGVPSGRDFALIAHKHQDKVVAPDAGTELFALAEGELVAIGFPVPYAGDPGAWYALSVARVRDGKIVEWWYSGYPSGHPKGLR